VTVPLDLPAQQLAYWNAGAHERAPDPALVTLTVGPNCGEAALTTKVEVRE